MNSFFTDSKGLTYHGMFLRLCMSLSLFMSLAKTRWVEQDTIRFGFYVLPITLHLFRQASDRINFSSNLKLFLLCTYR